LWYKACAHACAPPQCIRRLAQITQHADPHRAQLRSLGGLGGGQSSQPQTKVHGAWSAAAPSGCSTPASAHASLGRSPQDKEAVPRPIECYRSVDIRLPRCAPSMTPSVRHPRATTTGVGAAPPTCHHNGSGRCATHVPPAGVGAAGRPVAGEPRALHTVKEDETLGFHMRCTSLERTSSSLLPRVTEASPSFWHSRQTAVATCATRRCEEGGGGGGAAGQAEQVRGGRCDCGERRPRGRCCVRSYVEGDVAYAVRVRVRVRVRALLRSLVR
jgi:hypothetical protein